MLALIIENLIGSIYLVFTAEVLLAMVAGIIIGLILGAIPGLGSSIGIGVLLPITFGMNPVAAIALLVTIYKGVYLGGSFSSILINTPGTAGAAATALDGYPLARKGSSRKALQAAILSSGFGDLFSDLVLIIGSVMLARVVLRFGPPEMLWVILFALVMTGSLAGASLWKGILSLGIGLLLGTIGVDPITSVSRFGFIRLLGRLEGLPIVAVLLGAFAFSEVFMRVIDSRKKTTKGGSLDKDKSFDVGKTFYGPSLSLAEIKESLKAFFIGSILGTIIGIVPGMGASAGAFISYGTASNLYGNKSSTGKFGEGAVPGIVAAEAGNSAVSGANLLPLLTLGIPGSAAAALLLGALLIQGIQPGPLIFRDHGDVVYAVFLALIIGNIFNMIFGYLLVKPLIRLLKADPNIVFPIIALISLVGVYSISNRVFDLGIVLAVGFLAFMMRRVDIPIAPMVIAFVLSKAGETAFRQSMGIARGDFGIFLASPISKALMIITVVSFILVVIQRLRQGPSIEEIKG